MGGYRVKRRVLVLRFEDEEYAGMEARVRSISLRQALDLGGQADMMRAGSGMDQTRELVEVFADKLESWNLEFEETGEPIPCTAESILDLDLDRANILILTWMDAMTAVSDRLGKGSTSGQQSPEEAIPTALL